MPTIIERFQNAWDAFNNKDPTESKEYHYGVSTYYKPDRPRHIRGNERSIIASILNRIAVDASNLKFRHCKVDEEGRYISDADSNLNDCLSLSANIDQVPQALMKDVVYSLLEEGVVAIVPTRTNVNPVTNDSYKIGSLRVGRVVKWFPQHVRVDLYNEKTGKHEEVTLPKKIVALPENPFYEIMNEPNSALQRLRRKLALLDEADERNAAGKLDMIIQLPYIIKSEGRRAEAEKRRKDIEMQLNTSKYGIAYTDGTEKITQLNRSLENNLLKQIEYLQNDVYAKLGITQEILNGSASEEVMTNYFSRIIEPILNVIVAEMNRKWFTRTAITQGNLIMYFRDPFKLVPVGQIADIADKFTRNEILSSNELRQIIGRKPSKDPKADELINSNLNHPDEGAQEGNPEEEYYEEEPE